MQHQTGKNSKIHWVTLILSQDFPACPLFYLVQRCSVGWNSTRWTKKIVALAFRQTVVWKYVVGKLDAFSLKVILHILPRNHFTDLISSLLNLLGLASIPILPPPHSFSLIDTDDGNWEHLHLSNLLYFCCWKITCNCKNKTEVPALLWSFSGCSESQLISKEICLLFSSYLLKKCDCRD